MIMAGTIATWPVEVLSTFAAQYGSPHSYSLIERAKLLGHYGLMARMIDSVQQAVLAPYSKKGKPPKALLPDNKQDRPIMSEEHKAEFDDLLGIGRNGG